MVWLKKHWPSILINILALLPLLWLVADFALDRLSADPIRDIQLRTGRYAIILLVISLAGTPLHRLLGFTWLRSLRRLAGLWAFTYAGLHLLNFIWLDYGFNLTYLRQDILEKPYAVVGLVSFILLIPLASTSTSGWQRRMGKRWKLLHRLVYPAALLGALHFIWVVKIDMRLPIAFTVLIVVLLFVRLPFVSRLLRRPRHQSSTG
jgi:sulfoxide reductase heme-binding subunit YedZ